jgi:hypothetical protein
VLLVSAVSICLDFDMSASESPADIAAARTSGLLSLSSGDPKALSNLPYALRISLSEAASRRLRLPASAMPSSSPLSAVQVPEKPIPTS